MGIRITRAFIPFVEILADHSRPYFFLDPVCPCVHDFYHDCNAVTRDIESQKKEKTFFGAIMIFFNTFLYSF